MSGCAPLNLEADEGPPPRKMAKRKPFQKRRIQPGARYYPPSPHPKGGGEVAKGEADNFIFRPIVLFAANFIGWLLGGENLLSRRFQPRPNFTPLPCPFIHHPGHPPIRVHAPSLPPAPRWAYASTPPQRRRCNIFVELRPTKDLPSPRSGGEGGRRPDERTRETHAPNPPEFRRSVRVNDANRQSAQAANQPPVAMPGVPARNPGVQRARHPGARVPASPKTALDLARRLAV